MKKTMEQIVLEGQVSKCGSMEELFLQYEGAGLAVRTEGGWRLTPKGFLVSNSIIAALQEALGQQKAARLAAAAEGDFRVV